MSSGMSMEDAKKVADKMTYGQAISNCLYARCVPYRKATKIKMHELLEEVKKHEETFEWCTDCKEYDQEKHCCHRWCKQIAYDHDETLQNFAQWLWDSGYLTQEAFTIRLVEQYKQSN